MKKLLLILMMVSFVGVNTAQAYSAMGAGATSCGEVMSSEGDRDWMNIYETWMFGFISGLNAANASDKGANTEWEGRAFWYAVMNQCQAEPLDDFANAIYTVYRYELTE